MKKKTFIFTGTILSSLIAGQSVFAAGATYPVQNGDTLWSISQKYNATIEKLKADNSLSSNIILPGQVLKISSQQTTYVVKPGDSLSQIAENFNMTVSQLIKLNPTISNPNLIIVGETVLVSGQSLTNGLYTVQLGDTLSDIAKANNTTVEVLLALNPIVTNVNNIRAGQQLVVSGKVVTMPTTNNQSPVSSAQIQSSTPAPTQSTVPVAPIVQQPSTAATKPTATNTATSGSQLIADGEKYLGAKYLYGASSARTDAFDCSSFTQRVFADLGISIPRTTGGQQTIGTPVPLSQLQIGDLVFFDTDGDGAINHVGIYAGNGRMLNSQNTYGVSYANINQYYWAPRMVKAVRVF